MEAAKIKEYWNRNAEAWTKLSRQGYDLYRDQLNTPAFLERLPPVAGLAGLDIGCGEGHNTRLLQQLGAHLQAIDISEVFIREARSFDGKPGIRYTVASAEDLPFEIESFDFATSFMCYMDLADPARAMQEAWRVLKPGGFLQFSITHPCFNTPRRRNLRDASGNTYAIEVGDYFSKAMRVEEWIFGAAPAELKTGMEKFRIPTFFRTLSDWINFLLQAGFVLEDIWEPCPSQEVLSRYPYLQDSSVVAYFLHLRGRKPL